MKNLFFVLDDIISGGFDYSIQVHDPRNDYYDHNLWRVNFEVTAKANSNLTKIKEIILNIINNISLNAQDVTMYENQNIEMHEIKINGRFYYFRSKFSVMYLSTIFEKRIPLASLKFSVSDGISNSDCIYLLSNKDHLPNLEKEECIHIKYFVFYLLQNPYLH